MCRVTQVKFSTPSPQRTAINRNGGKSSTGVPSTTAEDPQDSAAAAATDEGEEIEHTGFLKEWTLMLHGTREPPYGQLSVRDPHSKLAIVKKAHTTAGPETTAAPTPKSSQQKQSAY